MVAMRNFMSGKSHWQCAARASCGFKMVLFTEPSDDLCQRYMRSTKCSSSFIMFYTFILYWLAGVRGDSLLYCSREEEEESQVIVSKVKFG